MSSTIKDAKGAIYAYEEKLVYDPDEKKEVFKQILIGKIDEKTGKIIPIEKEKTPSHVPAVIRSRTSKPEKFVLDTTKTGRLTFDEKQNQIFYDNGTVKIAIEKKGSNKEINTLLAIKFDENSDEHKSIRIFRKLNQFDRIVYDAITTLIVEGKNDFVTTEMIFHVMTGGLNKTLSADYADAINESISTLMYTKIVIDARDEGSIYPELINFIYDSTLLPAKRITAQLNGYTTSCLQILSVPPLFDYASRKNQIARVNIDVLCAPFDKKTGKGKNESKEFMTLAYYLIRRITAIKRTSNIILYDTVYEELGLTDSPKQKKYNVREKIKHIIEAWKGIPIGDIKITGFEEKREKGIVRSIVVNYEIIKCDK